MDHTSGDDFIDSIFDTGLLASATEATPTYGRTPHCTPSTSPVEHHQGFSPNRIKQMFDHHARDMETPPHHVVEDVIMSDEVRVPDMGDIGK